MTKMNCLRVFVPSWRGFAIVWLAICFWPAPAAAPPVTTTSDPSLPGTAPGPAGAPPLPGQSPMQLYNEANADYMMGQFGLAIKGFEAFLSYYPKNDMADDAMYNIGQSYFNDNKFTEAAAAYARVISDYPGGNQVPNAYYKRGLSLEHLPGQMDAAKQSYQAVVEKFADSQAAILAKQRLEALKTPPR